MWKSNPTISGTNYTQLQQVEHIVCSFLPLAMISFIHSDVENVLI